MPFSLMKGFYIYDGPQIEIITFDRLTEKSWIFIQSLVQTVIIKTGESSLCHNVVSQKEYDSRYTVFHDCFRRNNQAWRYTDKNVSIQGVPGYKSTQKY
jgi:hypothetical protein